MIWLRRWWRRLFGPPESVDRIEARRRFGELHKTSLWNHSWWIVR